MARIPVSSVDLSGNEERYVADAVRSTWISSTGPYVERFEREFAKMCGTKSAIGTCNGTAALHLALWTMDLRPGDEVIVPSLTYVATANACRYLGAEPVFVDVDPATWCIDPDRIEGAITPRTRGILPVHLYGHPADMDRINAIAAAHRLWVVEDAAEAHLAQYRGRPVGGLSSIATFSFYGNKIFTAGEGGAVTTSDPDLEKRARLLRGQGMDPGRRYYFPVTGNNFRMTNLACALVCAQFERKEQLLARRRSIFSRYREQLEGTPGIHLQPIAPWAEPAQWLFCITVDGKAYGRNRDELMAHLNEQDIDTRPFFIPLHGLPMFREESAKRGDSLPVTERLGSDGMNLPTYTLMTDSDIDRVCDAIRQGRR